MGAVSAGILLYRRHDTRVEVLIAHPGGPFFAAKQVGAWSIPKGLVDADEDVAAAARREWEEETGMPLPDAPWADLGDTHLRSGKRVCAWAVQGDIDPNQLDANTFELEWPPRSGSVTTFPEIDQLRWVSPDEARQLLNPAQVVFVDRLLKVVGDGADA